MNKFQNAIRYERNADGTFTRTGSVRSRYVYVQALKNSIWSWPTKMNRKHIVGLIEEALERDGGARLKCDAYRLVEAESILTPEDKSRLKALKARKEDEAHDEL